MDTFIILFIYLFGAFSGAVIYHFIYWGRLRDLRGKEKLVKVQLQGLSKVVMPKLEAFKKNLMIKSPEEYEKMFGHKTKKGGEEK